MPTVHSDHILDVVETFLDTCPGIPETTSIKYQKRVTGENPTVRMMHVEIGGDTYLVQAKLVGA